MSKEEVAKKEVNVVVTEDIKAPIHEVWRHVSSLGTEHLWYLDCTAAQVKSGFGKGAIRVLHFPHGVYTERIEDSDPTTYRFVYRILEPHHIPAKDPVGVIQLKEVEPSVTRASWTSTADSWDEEKKEAARELGQRTYKESFAALRKLCTY
ncbi:bet v i allergen [Neofusicoccum parvum]|uniref:Bet v i allergen, partial n=1 Tax=Neofusicoccum parvum TaxID=310453 RepID=A0ACB5SDU4_9PEZI|nr:bet v i allergen [Neofusicoccum parvum]